MREPVPSRISSLTSQTASPATVVDAIERAALVGAERGFRFLDENLGGERVTYADLERETGRIGGALQQLGLARGDRLALMLPDNREFLLAFLGAIRAGVVPVPICPPLNAGQLGHLDNVTHIVRKSGAAAIVASMPIRDILGPVKAASPSARHVLAFEQLERAEAPFRAVSVRPDDLCFLQFTSGSVSRPKGVMVTHANLIANAQGISRRMGVVPEDQAVSWLPLFHDMGLIGFVSAPLVSTASAALLPSLLFMKRPGLWLRTLSSLRGTVSAAPNFAYALCVKRVRPAELEGVDLSAWRIAACGSEPIRHDVLRAFAARFAPHGFREDAFLTAYGLAESTLAVSMGSGLRTDAVHAATLEAEGRAEAASGDGPDVSRVVCCGRPLDGHDVAVFAADDRACAHPLPERRVGEICVRGPSVARGYYDEPEFTAAAFGAGWLRTGDLGYLAGGEVYVCGRSKELIIVRGRNLYPQDIEWEARQVPGVRLGNIVAFGVRGEGTQGEQVVLVAETVVSDAAKRVRMADAVRARLQESLGLALSDVAFLGLGALPKTSSGKLRRRRVQELYERGELSTSPEVRDAVSARR